MRCYTIAVVQVGHRNVRAGRRPRATPVPGDPRAAIANKNHYAIAYCATGKRANDIKNFCGF